MGFDNPFIFSSYYGFIIIMRSVSFLFAGTIIVVILLAKRRMQKEKKSTRGDTKS